MAHGCTRPPGRPRPGRHRTMPSPARSSSRAWSRASASGRSSGAWPRSSGSPAASATPPGRVEIEAAGPAAALDAFARRLRTDAPPRARVERVTVGAARRRRWPRTCPSRSRSTRASSAAAADRLFPPDIATCDDCLRELFDPADRRYRYPFTNCTNCGPRATIIEELPYDRAQTTMRAFPLCAACERRVPRPREPPVPRRARRLPGLRPAARRGGRPARPAPIGDGRGARWPRPSRALRTGRSSRSRASAATTSPATPPTRPPSAACATASAAGRSRSRSWSATSPPREALCRVGALERRCSTGPARPIVLLEARRGRRRRALAPSVAAGQPAPGRVPALHAAPPPAARGASAGPLVLTSGNLTDEPLATDDDGRPRPPGRPRRRVPRPRPRDPGPLRRLGHARGRPARVRRPPGARLRPGAAAAAGRRRRCRCSPWARSSSTRSPSRAAGGPTSRPHNGDLEDLATHRAFTDGLAHLSRLLALEPEVVVHDLHPEYLSTKYAAGAVPGRRSGSPSSTTTRTSPRAPPSTGSPGPFLGVAYDGLGMGDDGTFWGGEILLADLRGYRRLARFGRAPMPGGALAVKRPYRMALGYLLGAEALDGGDRDGRRRPDGPGGRVPRAASTRARSALVRTQVARAAQRPGRVVGRAGCSTPPRRCSGIRDVAEYEAQAAIDLELAAGDRRADAAAVPARPRATACSSTTRGPRWRRCSRRRGAGRPAARSPPRSRRPIAEVTRELLADARERTGVRTVCLSGGVFQNRRLASDAAARAGRATASRCSSTARSPSTTAG